MKIVDSLDTADRVMAIQRVPMFADLDIPDLERIVESIVERRYAPDEVVFRRGDIGDDLTMIVSGDVRLRVSTDETEIVRGPGEFVGELALLRRQPRSVDVIAGPDGMHGLVMDCRMLESILEERPQIAVVMLESLAERLA